MNTVVILVKCLADMIDIPTRRAQNGRSDGKMKKLCSIGVAHGTSREESGGAVHGTGGQCAAGPRTGCEGRCAMGPRTERTDVRSGAEHETGASTEGGKRVRQRKAHTERAGKDAGCPGRNEGSCA